MELTLPFHTHTWRASHHWGIITPSKLYHFLRAASLYQGSRDAAHEINTYLATDKFVPPNIRKDSRQSDVWRDYQQILPELGLIFPTKTYGIRLTQAGLAYLDGSVSFTDLLTTQAFRWQFPNAQNRQRSSKETIKMPFHKHQQKHGILIRPAVLLWQLLDMLDTSGETALLLPDEIENFAMPARTNNQVEEIFESLIRYRRSNKGKLPVTSFRQRNISDATTFLTYSSAFSEIDGGIALSQESIENADDIRPWMSRQADSSFFWRIPDDEEETVESWFNYFGTLNAEVMPTKEASTDFGYEVEPDEPDEITSEISLRDFDYRAPSQKHFERKKLTISTSYSAELSESAHRQHDAMVRLIAEISKSKDAHVSFDPSTLDLLVKFKDTEFLIEVKSASARNLHHKLRLAVGQVSYYDFLRSKQAQSQRRKTIALTLSLDGDSWVADFLNNHLDIDLLSLKDGELALTSRSGVARELFG